MHDDVSRLTPFSLPLSPATPFHLSLTVPSLTSLVASALFIFQTCHTVLSLSFLLSLFLFFPYTRPRSRALARLYVRGDRAASTKAKRRISLPLLRDSHFRFQPVNVAAAVVRSARLGGFFSFFESHGLLSLSPFLILFLSLDFSLLSLFLSFSLSLLSTESLSFLWRSRGRLRATLEVESTRVVEEKEEGGEGSAITPTVIRYTESRHKECPDGLSTRVTLDLYGMEVLPREEALAVDSRHRALSLSRAGLLASLSLALSPAGLI